MADALMADALMASATLTNPSPFLTYSPPRLPSKIVLGFPLIITVRLVLMGYVLEGLGFSVITEKYVITRIKKNLKLKCKVELLSFNMLKMSGKTTYVQVNSTDEPATMRASVVNCSGNSGSQKVELYNGEQETQYLKNLKAIIGENNVTISSIQKAYMLKEYNKQTYISKGAKQTEYTYKGDITNIDIINQAQAAQAAQAAP